MSEVPLKMTSMFSTVVLLPSPKVSGFPVKDIIEVLTNAFYIIDGVMR